jgi:tripartite-type tricarboxylate transporter receptor subunit TctC
VVENRAGASGMSAIDAVAKSTPDGYKWASIAPKVSNGGTNLGLNDKTAEREVLARADKDFERLFGAD